MHDASALLPIDQALQIVLRHAQLLAVETIKLSDAGGRVLAQAICADRDQPPFDRCAMDGVALATDAPTAGQPWQLVGTAAAGAPFAGGLSAGQCVRIYTGAQVPADAVAVVPVERIRVAGAQVVVEDAARAGQHIARKGSEVRAGATVVAAGTTLNAATLGVAAAFGHATVAVARRPNVAILPTGDEIVAVDAVPGPGQIRDSNRYQLAEIARRAGADVLHCAKAGDRRDLLEASLRAALAVADVVVTCGGVSAGDLDLVAPVLADLGAVAHFHKIRIKPGKPLLFATVGDKIVVGLPGNPVSAAVCAALFLVPLLAAMQGAQQTAWKILPMPLAADLGPAGPRDEIVPLQWAHHGAAAAVAPITMVGSADVFAFSRAQLLAIRPADHPAMAAGDLIDVLLWPLP